MSDKLFFLDPIFKHRIWGGRALATKFGYDIPEGHIGECWGISVHTNGESVIRNGRYAGKKLSTLWDEVPGLFGEQRTKSFSLLVKILDVNADLSVQVHPDDTYARINGADELGKTECWYIVDCDDDVDIILGHNARTKKEMTTMIAQGQWDKLFRCQPVKKGDFFYVPSGTIHALCRGMIVLEVQQSSDTTYRLYDYNRRDDAGHLRELHIDKAIDVSTVPHRSVNPRPKMIISQDELTITELVSNDFFTVSTYEIDGDTAHGFMKPNAYTLISIVEGSGRLEQTPVKQGDHLLVSVDAGALKWSGKFKAIVAQP